MKLSSVCRYNVPYTVLVDVQDSREANRVRLIFGCLVWLFNLLVQAQYHLVTRWQQEASQVINITPGFFSRFVDYIDNLAYQLFPWPWLDTGWLVVKIVYKSIWWGVIR